MIEDCSTQTSRWRLTNGRLAWMAVAIISVLIATMVSFAPASSAAESADLTFAREMLRNCQLQLKLPNLTSGERTAANRCVSAQTKLITSMTAPVPSPSVSPSTSPSPSPSPSATPPPPSPSPSVSPSPSPTPTPTTTGPFTNCLTQLAACGFPHAGNTGVPPGTALTIVTGNVTLATAGMIYEGKDVRGCVTVAAPNVTIRNSKVTCGGIEAGGNYTRIRNQSTSLILTDVDVDCGNNFGNGVGSTNLTAIRLNIHNCENGFDLGSPGNVVVRDTYIHDLWVDAAGTAHVDGMQWGQGASNITVEHNVIYNVYGQTAAIIMWDEGDPQNANVLIQNNLLAGGGYTLYCGKFGTAVNVRVLNNRFGPARFGPSVNCATGGEIWTGNVRDATGLPVPAA